MKSLQIESILPFVVPAYERWHIVLVGCGGTGSHVAQSLARLASHQATTGGAQLQLTFVDGDIVERKNVGRQLFNAADVGKNKAQVLAARFNAVFGLKIHAAPMMFTKDTVFGIDPVDTGRLYIGAVDNAAARRAIAELVVYQTKALWLDSGNHEAAGQVAIGKASSPREMHGALALGKATILPSPALLYPELLIDRVPQPREDCAAAMEDNAQSLMVNQMMAAIVAQYVYQLVVHRTITTFRTVVDLGSLTMRSEPITVSNLAAACGVKPDRLIALPEEKSA